jgi:hypothetical protein
MGYLPVFLRDEQQEGAFTGTWAGSGELGCLFIAVNTSQSKVHWQWSNCCLLEKEKGNSTQRTMVLVNKGFNKTRLKILD